MSGVTLRSGRFRSEREADWKRLDSLLKRVEGGGARALSDEELLAIPRLPFGGYRERGPDGSPDRDRSDPPDPPGR